MSHTRRSQALVQKASNEQISQLVHELPYLAFVSCDRQVCCRAAFPLRLNKLTRFFAQGTRAMQKLVTALRTHDDQEAFAQAMNPHVAQLAVHPNGSHGEAPPSAHPSRSP
jgi:hypothetical protein